MRVAVLHCEEFAFEEPAPVLVLPSFANEGRPASALLNPDDGRLVERLITQQAFTGKCEEHQFVPTPERAYQGVLLLGLGKRAEFDVEVLRRAIGAACESLRRHRIRAVVLDDSGGGSLPVVGFLEGLILGQYRFDRYKARKPEEPSPVDVESATIVVSREADAELETTREQCRRAALACENANWARDLANAAPNDMTPTRLADIAREMAAEAGCGYECLDRGRIAELGMNALLGVARGSVEPALLVVLRYEHAKEAETVGLLGKGVTFDTGGISIKPPEAMHEMKFDMCGAAAVLGAMKTLCRLRPAINIVCAAPLVENVPGATAQKPGDVIRAYNGKTIEVNNTDAEGRLILADALSYMVDVYRPSRMVDLATLTGTCIAALGHFAAGLMTNDDRLAASLERAAAATGERVWRLPLWADFSKLNEGTYADLCNVGPPKEAGTVVGGCFLKEFVGDTPWAHLDIAGTAWGVKNISYLDSKHATGYGVRLLTRWVCDAAEERVRGRG